MSIGDFAAFATAFATATVLNEVIQTRLLHRLPTEFYAPFLAERIRIIGFLSCLAVVWLAYKKHYTGRREYWAEVRQILGLIATLALVDGWLHFALKMQASRLWQFQLWIYTAFLLIGGRTVVRKILMRLGLWQQPTLLIGPSQLIKDLRSFTKREHYLGYEIGAAVDTDRGDNDVLSRVEDHLTHRPDLRYALVVCEGLSPELLAQIVGTLESGKVSYGLIPPVRGTPLFGLKVDYFIGYDFVVLQSHRPLLNRQQMQIAKRAGDIIGALLLLLGLSPVVVAIAALLYVEGGPILYRSRRLGFGGSTFYALKFRTMRPDADRVLAKLLEGDPVLRAEWQHNYKLQNDPRITWFGRFLRRTSADEVPQLINVLRGEMSLVGPRPMLLDEVPDHESELHLYTKVLPGITGMWQVSGRNDLNYQRRMQLNKWYVQNWSIWHDIVILMKTIIVVARRRGAL